jgi:glycosyltransferase involved in cell wall biosynthesis
MNLDQLTLLLLTYNEEANIARTLASVAWARRIVVVDSGSTDQTLPILAADARVKVVQRGFDTHADQWNFALAQAESEWVLCMDADYLVSREFMQEIAALNPDAADGWAASFTYCINGRPLRASLLPPRLVLFRKALGDFYNDGHTQLLRFSGRALPLHARLLHDDRKPLEPWLHAQIRYGSLEVAKLRKHSWRRLRWPDRARKLWLGPLLVVPYCLILKGLLLDGRDGIYYTLQRLFVEILLLLMLFERSLRRVDDQA